ncbi:PREDICTED: proline-rich protein 23D1-like [Galeopterus variegatus]|uniref:Proline-rich protein 23D1-like n=1 Tax=Galeopterus variegatus TaxID=482537 RepID=A0ABM0RNG5_GALVR|nr:PREDICTED: proline-rich protein 23D1-like [Galeopterus variegatus]
MEQSPETGPAVSQHADDRVVSEPGTELQLCLGAEVLVLAPQRALQLTLISIVIMVIPDHALRATGSQGSFQLPKLSPERLELPVELKLDLHGLGPLLSSAHRPLPPSPSPGPRVCHKGPRRPASKAQRCLFQQ